MKCVICKTGEVKPARVQAEIKVENDHLLVSVDAEVCGQCGEAYYSTDAMRHLDQVRQDFIRKAISPRLIGQVYQV